LSSDVGRKKYLIMVKLVVTLEKAERCANDSTNMAIMKLKIA